MGVARAQHGRRTIANLTDRSIGDLVAGVAGATIAGDAGAIISSIEFDSRLVEPGGLFVALRGGYVDGHAFLDQARERGAVAAMVERGHAGLVAGAWPAVVEVDDTRASLAPIAAEFYHHPTDCLTVIGVTGTDGKTTTSHLIEAMLRRNGRRTGLIGTVEVRVAGEVELHETRQTTPESLVVQRLLAAMRDRGVDTVVLEATSHGLAMHRLDDCAFDIGVVTNITHEHLDFHGSVEAYRAAKATLLERVAAGRTHGRRGTVVLNADDAGAQIVAPSAGSSTRLWYSLDADATAEVRALDIESRPDGTRFLLRMPSGDATVDLALPGRYNVANALAAAGVGHALGLSPAEIADGLMALESVPGRMQTVDEGQPFTVVVDYAHTPDAIRSVLRELRPPARGRLLVLFGSAGERDIEKRAIQGRVAIEQSDYAVFSSEDPRYEDPDAIIAAIAAGAEQAGGRAGVDFDCIEDRHAAIAAILERAEPGDVVVLAGKGHEKSMIYGAEKRPWDEAATAADILRRMGYRRVGGDDSSA